MKVLWALPSFDNPTTGGERVLNKIAGLLKLKGITVINTYQQHKTGSSIAERAWVNLNNFKRMLTLDKNTLIFQNLYNRRDLFFTNIFLHYFFRRRIILFINEIHEDNRLPFVRRCFYAFINYMRFEVSSLIVTNSKFTGNWVCKYGNFQEKLFLMYPCIDLHIKNFKKTYNFKNRPLNILCVGNIRQKKGQIYLLEAMKRIHVPFKLTLAGEIVEINYSQKLKRYINENNMADQVRFTGFLNSVQLAKEYEKADIFVLPTLKEGFGMAILEAMSFGLPIIASNVGGIPETITNEKEGVLIETANVNQLFEKIQLLIKDEQLAKVLGLNAQKRASQFIQFDRYFEELHRKLFEIAEGQEN